MPPWYYLPSFWAIPMIILNNFILGLSQLQRVHETSELMESYYLHLDKGDVLQINCWRKRLYNIFWSSIYSFEIFIYIYIFIYNVFVYVYVIIIIIIMPFYLLFFSLHKENNNKFWESWKLFSGNKSRPLFIHSVNQQTFVEDWQCAVHCFKLY